jgi:sugar phosphate isomerase/epimerase
MNRRNACKLLGAGALLPTVASADIPPPRFHLRHVLSSALYGDMPVAEVIPQVSRLRCDSLDIWPKIHATQREQVTAMGDEAFQGLLKDHTTYLSVSTCYPLGSFGQDDEMRWVKKNGGYMTVTGSGSMGEKNPQGAEAIRQVKAYFEKLKPHYELAEELDIYMAIENHANSMLSHPDSIRAFAEHNPSKNVGIAFAPHHLHEHIDEIPALIRELGAKQLPFVYFQEYSPSSKELMEKKIELQQLPGLGTLDYVPLIGALKEVGFHGLVEIFMHPVPRGIPILPTVDEIAEVILKSRQYIDECVEQVA